MSRLYITNKEITLINDLAKETIKDIVGQFVLYYPISTLKTKIHPIYEEAIEKIFENPIKLDCLINQPEWNTTANTFGLEKSVKFEVMIQARDLIDRGMSVSEGDYFVYDSAVFEIQSYINLSNLFGQAEYDNAFKIVGRLARPGTFDPKYFAKKDSKNWNDANITKDWQQQRGLAEINGQPTGDVRQVQERLAEEKPAVALGDGVREVKEDDSGEVPTTNFVYDD